MIQSKSSNIYLIIKYTLYSSHYLIFQLVPRIKFETIFFKFPCGLLLKIKLKINYKKYIFSLISRSINEAVYILSRVFFFLFLITYFQSLNFQLIDIISFISYSSKDMQATYKCNLELFSNDIQSCKHFFIYLYIFSQTNMCGCDAIKKLNCKNILYSILKKLKIV